MSVINAILLVSNWFAASLIAMFLLKYIPNMESRHIANLFFCNVLFISLRAVNKQLEYDEVYVSEVANVVNSLLNLGISIYFSYWLHINYGKKIQEHGKSNSKIQNA